MKYKLINLTESKFDDLQETMYDDNTSVEVMPFEIEGYFGNVYANFKPLYDAGFTFEVDFDDMAMPRAVYFLMNDNTAYFSKGLGFCDYVFCEIDNIVRQKYAQPYILPMVPVWLEKLRADASDKRPKYRASKFDLPIYTPITIDGNKHIQKQIIYTLTHKNVQMHKYQGNNRDDAIAKFTGKNSKYSIKVLNGYDTVKISFLFSNNVSLDIEDDMPFVRQIIGIIKQRALINASDKLIESVHTILNPAAQKVTPKNKTPVRKKKSSKNAVTKDKHTKNPGLTDAQVSKLLNNMSAITDYQDNQHTIHAKLQMGATASGKGTPVIEYKYDKKSATIHIKDTYGYLGTAKKSKTNPKASYKVSIGDDTTAFTQIQRKIKELKNQK